MTSTAPSDVRQHILDVALPLLLRKGFTAVGLTEVLTAAQVPKGSFYHYFGSKEAFGEAVLETYFAGYLARMDLLLSQPGTAAQRLSGYFHDWLDSQTGDEASSRCPVVKLGAEVSDLSESMRAALERGTRCITERLARCIDAGRADGSLSAPADSRAAAVTLYQNWLGASLLAKIARDRAPLDTAMAGTRQLLGLTQNV
ncbi:MULTISPECIES: TetR/AcrR family transcriptional regulator [unclassified Lysobacter]|uniref:TetR/AcrR family transcriptional regulator n=1 Tax=unclassified Lysobacter TaxID=2635362 RepID=UPI001BECCA43|nr:MULTISPECIES: TetR/AcrR family transcriptional regulator [unclassified Lysobacter]MBT2747237.1 TetR/AcrR family transcriptional regulator [Lysobacter sp. ISL-42]MBT2750259.1 TetR/AcrR family transcriptional regulator [Lysobacter sp. ISL-50]MBT2777775.1 TetR/AcrR family transcriptional regulator [Lysobacter sp. ISL-54]MBT2783711.1 TetR/AcrR family transcriptional regulator [Lysobacter sp. ISL-52]